MEGELAAMEMRLPQVLNILPESAKRPMAEGEMVAGGVDGSTKRPMAEGEMAAGGVDGSTKRARRGSTKGARRGSTSTKGARRGSTKTRVRYVLSDEMKASLDADMAALRQTRGKTNACKLMEKFKADKLLAAFEAKMVARDKARGYRSVDRILRPQKPKPKEVEPEPNVIVKTLRQRKMMKIKIDQDLIDMFENKPMELIDPNDPDPIEKMQMEFERDIVEQCRNNNGYAEVEVFVE